MCPFSSQRDTARVILCSLTLLCLFLARISAQTPATSAPDPFADDARFVKKRTVEARGLYLPDLLVTLQKETGITLQADRSVENDRVVLFAHDRTLGDILRSLADFFGFSWRKEGTGDTAAYILYQSETAQAQDRKEIENWYNLAAESILEELAFYKRLAKMSPKERDDLKTEVMQRVMKETDPRTQRALVRDYLLMDSIIHNPAKPIAVTFLEGVDKAKILGYLQGAPQAFSWSQTGTSGSLSPEIASRIIKLANEQPGSVGKTYDKAVVEIAPMPGTSPAINLTLRIDLPTGPGYNVLFPIALSDDDPSPEETGPPNPNQYKALQTRVNLVIEMHLWSSFGIHLQDLLTLPPLLYTLNQLEQQQPVDLISDTFNATTQNRFFKFDLAEKSIAESLATLCASFRHRWSYQNGFACLKSLDFASHRATQMPVALFHRLTRDKKAGPGLDDYAAITSLPNEVFAELISGLQRTGLARNYLFLKDQRAELRFWDRLTPDQRAQAIGKGLACKDLDPTLKALFLETVSSPFGSRRASEPTRKPEEWEKATLRIVSSQSLGWGYIANRGSLGEAYVNNMDVPKEDAFNQFKARRPDLRREEFWRVYSTTVTFEYSIPDQSSVQHVFNLPPLWRPADEAEATKKEDKSG